MIPHWTRVPAARSLLLCLTLVLITALPGWSSPGPGNPQQPGNTTTPGAGAESPDSTFRPYVPGEVIVRLIADSASIDSINALYGTTVKDFFDQLDIYILSADPATDIDSLVASLRQVPGVVFAHPNYVVSPLQSVQGSIPFSDADRIGSYSGQDAALRLRLSLAHSYATGTGVKVAVIDGGVNFTHPEIAGAVVSGWDFIDGDADAFDEPGGSNSGHGSFVAGVIHLAAPDAQIVAYRVADTSGRSNGDMVAEAILRAISDGCRVINLSLVMTNEHEVLRNALAFARSQDVMVIVAAGNGHLEAPTYPASDPNVITVAAIDSLDRLAEFSRFGNHVDLCAPGEWIYAPYSDLYAWWSGTSFAAPFVAGQAALKLSQAGGNLDWRSLHASLIATAENIYAENPDYFGKLGAGLADPVHALMDSVGIDTASVDPTSLFVSLPPGQTIQRCFNLYSNNVTSVFNATVLGGNITFTSMTADSVLGASATMCFTISSTGLAEGTYADTIQFDVSGVSNSPILVPVTLYVNDSVVITNDASVMPVGYSFWLPEGWTQMVEACAFLSSTNAPSAFTVHLKDSTGGSFIEIANSTGMTNDSVCISLHPAGLAPGVYCDTLVYRVNGVSYDLYQGVCLTIGDQPDSASVLPAYFYFASQPGDSPQSGCAMLISANSPASYWLEVANNSSWLHLIDSVGTTGDSVCFTVDNVASFAAGLFVDTIFCHVDGAANTPAIVITLDVGGTGGSDSLWASPSSFSIVTGPQSGAPIQARSFVLSSSNAPTSYTAVPLLGASWLRVVDSVGLTNDSVRFTVDATGLPYGFYSDSIACVVDGNLDTVLVAVNLTVVGGEDTVFTDTATAYPSHFTLSAPAYSEILYVGCLTLLSSNAPAPFTASARNGSPWLTVHHTSGMTNDSVCFGVTASGLSQGYYVDTIDCYVDGATNVPAIPVVFHVTGDSSGTAATASASPPYLIVSAPLGSEALIYRSFVLSSSNAPAAFTADIVNSSAWLQLLDTGGETDDSVRVVVNPAAPFSGGSYTDSIRCIVSGVAYPVMVPVTLTLTADSGGAPTASVTPNVISHTDMFGAVSPTTRCVWIASSNSPASYSAWVADSSGTFTTILDPTGTTDDSLCVYIDPTGLGVGVYTDTVWIWVDGVSQALMLVVQLQVDMSKVSEVTNYPNPFNPTTTISFELPVASEYTITVYNVSGQNVSTLQGRSGAGQVNVEFNGASLSSGIYLYRVEAGSFSATRKMLLLK